MFELRLKFHSCYPKGPTDKMPALVQMLTWRRTGAKPLSEPMMAYDADAHMNHSASVTYDSNLIWDQ